MTVHFSSVAQSWPTLWDPMDCSPQGSLSITNSRSLLRLMSIESVMPSNHTILCRSLLLLPSIFPSIRVFFPMSQFFTAVANVLEFQLQHHFLQWIFRTDFHYNWLVWSHCSPRDSQESSPTPQFKSISYIQSITRLQILGLWPIFFFFFLANLIPQISNYSGKKVVPELRCVLLS